MKDKVVVVTGSARGIGYAIAEAFGGLGAKVVLSDVIDLTHAETALRARGVTVMSARCDVSIPEDCAALVKAALEAFGRIDVVVNNAGVSIVAPFEDCRPAACKKVIDINVLGSMYMSLAALSALREARGNLIFISSVSGVRAIPKGAVYSASKAALRSLAESLRVELAADGVHVGVVSPGFTTSDAKKTVMNGDGTERSIDRPPHDTPEGVAREVVRAVERRSRERVLTPMGKTTAVLQRVSPRLLDKILSVRALRD